MKNFGIALLGFLACGALLMGPAASAATPPAVDQASGSDHPQNHGEGSAGVVQQVADDGPWMVRVYGGTAAQAAAIADRFDHIGVYPEKDMILLQAEDGADWFWLLEQGLDVRIDEQRTDVLRTIDAHLLSGRGAIGSIPGFECYRTVEETMARGAQIAADYPALATWSDIGDSWEKENVPGSGYDIKVLKLTNSAIAGDKPALLVTGSTHAREYTTAELVTRFAEHLVDAYGVDPDVTWILDHHEIHLVLVLNPDGRKRAETGLSWRKNANNDFCSGSNNRGIDLNRNFDFMWGNSVCSGSSASACSLSFHGPSAGSEPEAQTLQSYMESIFPDQRADDQTSAAPLDSEGIYIDVHSFGEVVLTSWGCAGAIGPPPNESGILTLARKYAFFPGYTANIGSLGTVDGSTKDFSYGRLGVPGYTVELGTSFFESCSYFEEAIFAPNLEALTHIAKNVRTPYVTPSGPDAYGVVAPTLPVAIGSSVVIEATIDDTRYNTAGHPTHTLHSAAVFVDTPPWAGGTPVAMAAVDGTFDQTVEAVTATLPTAGLDPGRHTLFVRGRDNNPLQAGGTFGALTATFIYLIDPSVAPTLSGTVRDADTGAPLLASVTIGSFEISAAAGTGAYSLQVPAGTYDVTVSAPGYAPREVSGLALANLDAMVRDFRLEPLVEMFSDDVEGGNAGWTAQAPWAITTEEANSPTRSWTESPGGNYASNANTSLTSPVFDLRGFVGTRLTFLHLFDFEADFDRGLVEWSTDGATWVAAKTFSQPSQNAAWTTVSVALPELDGQAQARVRFRLRSDGGVNRDGWHIDDILLEAAEDNGIFADGFESGDTVAWSSTVP